LYIRGYIYTILRKNRFRITYRYGGVKEYVEGEEIPRDIRKACKLLTCIDILSTDFAASDIPYGGEGQVGKDYIMEKWQNEANEIIQSHSEILTVW